MTEYLVTFEKNPERPESVMCRIKGVLYFLDNVIKHPIQPREGEVWKVKVTGRATSGTFGFVVPVQYICKDALPEEYRKEVNYE